MQNEERPKWINLVFVIIIIAVVLLIFISRSNLGWQKVQEIVIALIIILVFFLIVYLASRRLFSSSRSLSDDISTPPDIDENSYEYSSDFELAEKKNSIPESENDFDTVLGSIGVGFNPDQVKDEEDAENQLLIFLDARFPNKSLTGGHTSTGKKVDIVIDGTYCIELAIVNNEARLVSIMEQILKYKMDFGEVAVILLDSGEVPAYTIEKYVDSYKNAGAKVIIKKISIDENDKEK